MSGWSGHEGCFKDKFCAVCNKEFTPKSGVHRFCSESCKGKWKYITGSGDTCNQYRYISGNWRRYLSRLCAQKHRVDLTVEILLELAEEQNYKCALSGITLTCNLEKGVISKSNASIDRIDVGGPYVKENIQLVCRALNSWRSDTPLSEFIWWCKQVAATHAQEER